MEDLFFLYSLQIVNAVPELKVIHSNRNAVRWKLSTAELLWVHGVISLHTICFGHK